MNILFLTTHLNVGGITSYLLSLSQQYVQLGHQVTVVSAGGELDDAFRKVGAQVLNLNIRTKCELHPKLFWAVLQLCGMVRKHSFEVIHGQTRITQVMGQVLGFLTRTPYVATCHGFYKTRWFRRVFPCWGEAVVAISPAVREHLLNDFHMPSERIFFVPHGVDIPRFLPLEPPERQNRLQEKKITGKPIIGIIARLADVKGHDILIKAMPKVLQKFPQAQLVIVGEGKMKQFLHELVRELGLTEHVLFFPVQHRTPEYLPLFDLFVLPSLEEGLGLSVLEAQACGLPVVASNVGGLKTLVETGQTGILVEPGNVEELAQAIVRMLSDPEGMLRMGLVAQNNARRHRSSERMAGQTLKIYEHVVLERKQK